MGLRSGLDYIALGYAVPNSPKIINDLKIKYIT
jgi:hypothetical protein